MTVQTCDQSTAEGMESARRDISELDADAAVLALVPISREPACGWSRRRGFRASGLRTSGVVLVRPARRLSPLFAPVWLVVNAPVLPCREQILNGRGATPAGRFYLESQWAQASMEQGLRRVSSVLVLCRSPLVSCG